MKLRILAVLIIAGMLVTATTPPVRAESEIPGPNQLGIAVNPNAPGTKLTGVLSIVADFTGSPTCVDSAGLTQQIPSVNFLAVLKLAKGNSTATFSGETDTAHPLCFGDINGQAQMVAAIVSQQVVPFFFSLDRGTCTMPACFEVKSLTNVLPNVPSNTAPPAISMDIVLAVHP